MKLSSNAFERSVRRHRGRAASAARHYAPAARSRAHRAAAQLRRHMTHNPYAPPTSNVADSSAVLPTRIAHAHVARACHLLWLSFGLAVLGATFDVFRASVSAGRSVTVIGAAAGATMVFLITLWFT